MAFSFRAFTHTMLRGVKRFANFFGERFFGIIALGVDASAEAARLAVKAPWLGTPNSPDDVLPLIGSERMIERAHGETNAQYRTRLLNAWDLWEDGGQHGGGDELSFAQNALAPFGIDPATVQVRYQPDPDWDGDSYDDNWSRVWVLVSDPSPWELLYIDGTWQLGDDVMLGLTAPPVIGPALRRAMRKYKAGWELVMAVIFTDDPAVVTTFEAGSASPPITTVIEAEQVAIFWCSQVLGDDYPFWVIGAAHPTIPGQLAKLGAILP